MERSWCLSRFAVGVGLGRRAETEERVSARVMVSVRVGKCIVVERIRLSGFKVDVRCVGLVW